MIAVLTGAGMSAESGLSTFRDSGGLWEGHDVMQVASPQGWAANPELVNSFYNQRRRDLQTAEPNAAHKFLGDLEDQFDIHVITQNVDNLHERGGSSKVLHLHGELLKVRSTGNADLVYDWTGDLRLSDVCEEGYPLRPDIVWFGEEVPAIPKAAQIVYTSQLFLIIGTSLQVYPAAGLIQYVKPEIPIIYVDPRPSSIYGTDANNIHVIAKKATEALPELEALITQYL